MNDWIPVSERLPKENMSCDGYSMGKWILCSCKGGRIENSLYYKGKFEMLEEIGYEVLAWQPLPEPYKGGE